MNHLKRTFVALLAMTVAGSGVAFGQFAPPGGPPRLPMGGPPRLQMGGMPRPPLASQARPPVSARNRLPVKRPTHAPNVGGAKRRLAEGPGRGGNNFGNIRNTLDSGGNINGNRTFANSGAISQAISPPRTRAM